MNTISIFIDTSVLFSAVQSKVGASARIMGLCKKGLIKGFISDYVIAEAKRNARKLDQKQKQRLHIFLQQGKLKRAENPTVEEIKRYEVVIKLKDAPVVAAAMKSKVDFLITLDTKDFKKQSVQKVVKLLQILTPREFASTHLV